VLFAKSPPLDLEHGPKGYEGGCLRETF
jgi:hypothetical protein